MEIRFCSTGPTEEEHESVSDSVSRVHANPALPALASTDPSRRSKRQRTFWVSSQPDEVQSICLSSPAFAYVGLMTIDITGARFTRSVVVDTVMAFVIGYTGVRWAPDCVATLC